MSFMMKLFVAGNLHIKYYMTWQERGKVRSIPSISHIQHIYVIERPLSSLMRRVKTQVTPTMRKTSFRIVSHKCPQKICEEDNNQTI